MELGLFDEVLRDVRRSFPIKPIVHLIGGEPLLHPKIETLIGHARGRGFSVAMTTNGFLLENRASAVLPLRQVTVSVDGPEDIHDGIRGVRGSFARAIEGVRAVARLRRATRPLLATNCTITPSNTGHLCDTVRALQAVPIDSLTLQHLSFGEDERDFAAQIDLAVLREELEAVTRIRAPFPINVFPPIRPEHLEAYYRDPTFPFGRGCLVPWVTLRVYEDGTVAPCQDFIVGRVGDCDVRRLWNGRPMGRIRRRIRKGELFPECGRCCHRRYYPLAGSCGSTSQAKRACGDA
jgi:MoaA/NifB/PqqE/SkfB family radical SAM enzyme